jgi:hypothetical protein
MQRNLSAARTKSFDFDLLLLTISPRTFCIYVFHKGSDDECAKLERIRGGTDVFSDYS